VGTHTDGNPLVTFRTRLPPRQRRSYCQGEMVARNLDTCNDARLGVSPPPNKLYFPKAPPRKEAVWRLIPVPNKPSTYWILLHNSINGCRRWLSVSKYCFGEDSSLNAVYLVPSRVDLKQQWRFNDLLFQYTGNGSPSNTLVVAVPSNGGKPVIGLGSGSSASVPGMTAGSQYKVTVNGLDSQNRPIQKFPSQKPYTQSGTFPRPAGVPGPPTLLSATGSSGSLTGSIKAPSTGGKPTGYILVAVPANGGAPITIYQPVPLTNMEVTLSQLPAGTYTVYAAASNSIGVSPASNGITVTVYPPKKPPPPK
jgi:hypothetical protein